MAGRLQECEYTDQGPALTQVLEDEVARLEARIRELEHPTDNLPVTLHNPHAAYFEAQTRRTSRSDVRNQPNGLRKTIFSSIIVYIEPKRV